MFIYINIFSKYKLHSYGSSSRCRIYKINKFLMEFISYRHMDRTRRDGLEAKGSYCSCI